MLSGIRSAPPAAAPAAISNRNPTALTLCPPAEHLVDRGEVDLEAVPGRAQVEPPDAEALRARDLLGSLQILVEVRDPVPQRLGVVGAELLDVPDDEAGPLQSEDHPGDVQRLA